MTWLDAREFTNICKNEGFSIKKKLDNVIFY